MLSGYRHQLALALKRAIYSKRGEPYEIAGHTLRYVPGTRPVRLRYADSANAIVRYDALQMLLLSNTMKEGDTAIDVGAHWGSYCLLMAARAGESGHIVAFEPDPHALSVLEQNLRLNPLLKRPIIESCACSDAPGEAVLYSDGGNANSSLARTGVDPGEMKQGLEQVRVQLVTLDDYIRAHRLRVPRWVKIDAEGAEIRILKGARNLLDSDAGVICELHPYAWPEFGNNFDELQDVVAASRRRMRYLDQSDAMGSEARYGTVVLERTET